MSKYAYLNMADKIFLVSAPLSRRYALPLSPKMDAIFHICKQPTVIDLPLVINTFSR